MNSLLKLEFRKLRKQKSFYIILAIMVALIAISALVSKLLESLANEFEEIADAMSTDAPSFTGTGILLGFVSSSMFTTLTAIFVAIVVCDDYESQIIKNIFARGYSRTDFFFAKMIYVIVTTSIMFIASVAAAAVFSAALFGISGDIGKIVILLSVQYLACLSMVLMFFGISTVIKKLGGTIAANIIAPILINLVLSLVNSLLNIENFSFTDIWLSSFTSSLSALTVETSRIIVCAALSVGYAVAFSAVGYFFASRTEA